jgi:hypothetical protein
MRGIRKGIWPMVYPSPHLELSQRIALHGIGHTKLASAFLPYHFCILPRQMDGSVASYILEISLASPPSDHRAAARGNPVMIVRFSSPSPDRCGQCMVGSVVGKRVRCFSSLSRTGPYASTWLQYCLAAAASASVFYSHISPCVQPHGALHQGKAVLHLQVMTVLLLATYYSQFHV